MGVNSTIAKIQNNMLGTIVGAGVGYWVGKKYMSTGTWATVGIALVGAIAGAYVQSTISAKGSVPDKGTVR